MIHQSTDARIHEEAEEVDEVRRFDDLNVRSPVPPKSRSFGRLVDDMKFQIESSGRVAEFLSRSTR